MPGRIIQSRDLPEPGALRGHPIVAAREMFEAGRRVGKADQIEQVRELWTAGAAPASSQKDRT
ncbi:hypothetical protein [Erythrobacter tepidarius]|uniref:hypothetical protein n=1 Tax=Erythrobacter tepidarius TaxID=60454 RepID=UPI000A3B5144|nr:hypothetical protein [Erythrobacter tepidarius]